MPYRRFGRVAVERHAPAGKAGRVDPPEQQIGIGHRRPGPAAAIAGRPRIGASAVRPDGDPFQPVDPRDRAAACADFDHLDDRDAQWQAAALLEAVDPRDLKGAAGLRLQLVDQADLRGGPAHVIRQNLVEAALSGDLGGEDGAARRPRLDEPHRKADRGLDRGQPAARQHQEQRAGKPLLTQQGFEIGEVAADQRLDISVCAGGREALVFAHLGRHFARQGDRDTGQAIGQISPTRRSCVGLVKLCRKPTAIDSIPSVMSRPASVATPASSSGTSTRPPASMRSRTGKRSRRGTSGGGRSMLTSYCSNRFSCRISIVSRKPSVVRSAVFAPLRSISALVARVVPWMMIERSAGASARRAIRYGSPR